MRYIIREDTGQLFTFYTVVDTRNNAAIGCTNTYRDGAAHELAVIQCRALNRRTR